MKDVMPPERTYTDRQTISLGGKRVEMIHPGPNHSTDATVLYFPDERVVQVVDFVSIRRAFASVLNVGDPSPADWIASFRVVEGLDFDLVTPGHGLVGTKADVVLYRQYFEELIDRVSAGIRNGASVEQLIASDMLDKYSWLSEYTTRRAGNIRDAYKVIQAAAP
jgi:cyclase